jgi:mannose-1-phosphate guanylyltransferase
VVGVRAVVLVGGEGTRLRPLTETTPKPLLPLVDRPILDHVLDHLARHGVREAVLSSPYLPTAFGPFLEARRGDPRVTWVTETEPLGTGGAIVNALSRLGDAPFFALNGDIVTDLDLTAMRAAHERARATVTIALHRVEDARAFGLVEHGPDGRVVAFREKPAEAIPGMINAGTYLIDPSCLRRWTADRPISIEREIFPAVIEAGERVMAFPSEAYWMDLGTPEQYLQAHLDLLLGRVAGIRYPAPWVHPDAEVDLRAHLGRGVAVGSEAWIGPAAQVDDAVLHAGSRVEAGARVVGSVLGPGARVGERATVVDCVLGAGASVAAGQTLRGERVPGPAAEPVAER